MIARSLAAATLIAASVPVLAEERRGEPDGINLDLAYTGEVLAGGGGDPDYVDNFDLIIDAKAGDTRFHAYALYNNGSDFSGPRFSRGYVVSNLETGLSALRLYEAWIEQPLAGGRVTVRAGLYDLNSEFDALEASSLFTNPAHGIGTDISQSGANGPSIFPNTSLALRIETQLGTATKLRAAVLDGVPGDPANPKRTAIRLGSGDGALLIGELDQAVGKLRLIAGYWRYTARFEDALASQIKGTPFERRGSQGAYLRGEGLLAGSAEGSGLDGFFRLGWTDARFHETGRFASAGLRWRGTFRGRDEDAAGVAVAYGRSSPRTRQVQTLQGDPIAVNEWSFEATYAFKAADWLTLQPSLQYLVNPAYEPGRKAWIGGLRMELGWSF